MWWQRWYPCPCSLCNILSTHSNILHIMDNVWSNRPVILSRPQNFFSVLDWKTNSPVLKIRVAYSFEMSAFFYWTTCYHISQKGNPHSHHLQTSYLIYLDLIMNRFNKRRNINYGCASWIVQQQYHQTETLYNNVSKKTTDSGNMTDLYQDSHPFAVFTHFLQYFYSYN